MVARLKEERPLPPEIEAAFLAVPREEFVPEASRESSYTDLALPLQAGATISQPSMLVIMLLELRLKRGVSVLEAGSGCGYFLALLAAAGAKACGVEIITGLAKQSRERLDRLGYDVEVIDGDASKVEFGRKFGRVVFSAAVSNVPHWSRKVLEPGGFVLAPVGDREYQELVRAYEVRTEFTGRLCRFVPFV